MNKFKLFEQLINKHNPTREQQRNIKEKVFTQLNLELPKRKFLTPIFGNQGVLLGFASTLIISIFVGLPLILSRGLEQNNVFLGNDISGGLQEATESDGTDYGITWDSDSEETIEYSQDMITNIMPEPSSTEDQETKEENRAKEKRGYLSLIVEDVNSSIDEIYELTVSAEGYVVDSYFSSSNNGGAGEITIRIPSNKFEFAMKSLRDLSVEVRTETTNILDLQNELSSNMEEQELVEEQLAARYKDLQEAKEEDKYIIENAIQILENQKEMLENQEQQLTQETSFATISINLEKKKAADEEPGIKEIVSQTWEEALIILTFWARVGIWATLVVPAILLPAIILLIARKIFKYIKRK